MDVTVDGGARLASLRRRYVAISALRWLPVGLLVPVLVVLLGARGVALDAIGPLLALYSVLVVTLELPTGGMADRFGRRRVHVVATVLSIVGLAIFGFAEGLGMFALSMVPLGINRALLSGPLEAWFVDQSHAIDPAVDLSGAFARAESMAALALGAGALATALLAQVVSLPETGAGLIAPSLPVFVAAGAEVVHLLAALVLMRPDSVRDGAFVPAAHGHPVDAVDGVVDLPPVAGAPATIRDTVRAALVTARGPVLRRILVAEAVLAVALVVTEQVVPVDLVRLLGERDAASTFALLAAAGFAVVSVGARFSTVLSGRLGARRGYTSAVVLVALALAVPAVRATPVTIAVAYLAIYLALGMRSPLRSTLLHARVTADRRATVLSVVSLVFQLAGMIVSLALLPLYARTSPTVAFLVPAAVVAIGAAVIGRSAPGTSDP